MLRALLCAGLLFTSVSCFASPPSVGCTPGDIGCTCTAEGQCGPDLVCKQNYCMPESCTPGELHCACDQGTCQRDLVCLDDAICLPPDDDGSTTGSEDTSPDPTLGTSSSDPTRVGTLETTDATHDETTVEPSSDVDSGADPCIPGTATFDDVAPGVYTEVVSSGALVYGSLHGDVEVVDPVASSPWPFENHFAIVKVAPLPITIRFPGPVTFVTFMAGTPPVGAGIQPYVTVTDEHGNATGYAVGDGATLPVNVFLAGNPSQSIFISGNASFSEIGIDDVQWLCD